MKTKTQGKYDLTHLAMVGPDGIPVFLIPSATPDTALNERRKTERAKIVQAVNSHEALLEALREISKAMGRYSHDHLEHASNCIEDMQQIAREAIAQVEVKP